MKYEFMYNIRLQVNKAIQLKPHKSPQTPLRAIRQQINVIYDPRAKTKKRKVALLLLLSPPRRFTSASRGSREAQGFECVDNIFENEPFSKNSSGRMNALGAAGTWSSAHKLHRCRFVAVSIVV